MFERFTDKARTAVIAARTEASERGDQIRPVYLLHALAVGEGIAARALAGLGVDAEAIERRLDRAAPLRRPPGGEAASEDAEALASIGIDLDEIRRRVEEDFGPGALDRAAAPARGTWRITMTREARQSVELAAREARALRHGYVGTEHLLLGLISAAQRNPRGDFSPQTLEDLGIDPERARQQVLAELRRASA
jgi:ATP-dependent Clp protease ATP-binding subunit ClpA